jgi:hypothetical protein
MWLIVIAIHSALSIKYGAKGIQYYPSYRTMICVTVFAWGFPIVWWGVIGLSIDAYGSTGYFCWVRFTPAYISILFGDLPLIICCIVVTVCYCYVTIKLISLALDKKFKTAGGSSFRKEIQRSVSYIIVYVLWVHPYLTITIIAMVF